MAKKKAKKKAVKKKAAHKIPKKTKKKVAGGKKNPRRPTGPVFAAPSDAKTALFQKIHQVQQEVRQVKSTGTEEDDQGKYHYTEAKEVFRIYGDVMNRVGLTFMPVDIITSVDAKFYRATVTYEITDIETGYSTLVKGSGLGCNGVWSLNSAQTVARKQALLNAFGASYGDSESIKNVVRKQMAGFDITDYVGVDADPAKIKKDLEEQAKQVFG